MTKTMLLALMALSLASCGGDSGSDDYQMAIDQANAKQAEAVSLAATSPCGAPQQCANLSLVDPQGRCTAPYYRQYSLVSATADAASAAAAEERSLAIRAVSLAPPPSQACSLAVVQPPALACVSNTCQAALPAN